MNGVKLIGGNLNTEYPYQLSITFNKARSHIAYGLKNMGNPAFSGLQKNVVFLLWCLQSGVVFTSYCQFRSVNSRLNNFNSNRIPSVL